MSQHYECDIQGLKSSDVSVVTISSPYDQAPLATLETTTLAGVDMALKTAQQYLRDKVEALYPETRALILTRTADKLSHQLEDFALTVTLEGGKPLKDSRYEVIRAIEGLRECARSIMQLAGREIPMSRNTVSRHKLAVTRPTPIGLVVAFSAFNHPLNLIVHQVGTAIAAGCPIIIKPAEDTPLSCIKLVDLLRQSGLPKNFCQVIHLWDRDIATRLATDPRVNLFSFIGSSAVGWKLRSKLSPGTRCVLEHGGVAPVIISEDADIEAALIALTRGAFYHAGQVCVSVQRIYVMSKIAKKFAKDLAARAMALKVGDPCLEATDVGPLIRLAEIKRVEGWVKRAVLEGARVMCGGELANESCYAPTVLYDPPETIEVSTQEIFGPVVCVYPVESLQEAITKANALPFSFQASIFTESIDTSMAAFQHLKATAVVVNESPTFRVDWMPFTGNELSGLGVGGIPYMIQQLSPEKQLIIHSPALP